MNKLIELLDTFLKLVIGNFGFFDFLIAIANVIFEVINK